MVNMPLVSLKGNELRGPEFKFSLNYNPLSQTNMGLGKGVSTGLTVLDRGNNTLTLSTGEQYRLIPGTDEVRHQKMDSFRLNYTGIAYQVTHKDGSVEWLTEEGNELWLPTRLYTPAGHSLTLEWDASSGTPRLWRVTDDSKTELCSITYTSSEVSIKTSAGYNVSLLLTGDYVEQVIARSDRFEEDHDEFIWTLEYDWIDPSYNWLWGITGVTSPTGLKESVSYDRAEGMMFPELAGNRPALPRVTEHRRTPGVGQPDIVSTFGYSPYNYLGRGSNLQSWSPDSDCMLGSLTDYTYSSTETSLDTDGSEIITTREWNNYHLQELESVEHGDHIQETYTTYHALRDVDFSDQPVNCMQPHEVTRS
ncbi:MAG TPA: hypothetical protein VGM55_23670, partial [Cedecea sp.]